MSIWLLEKGFHHCQKIALEKGTYVAFNSVGTGQFLCKGPAFLLEAVAKHVDDKVDAGFDLETLDITIAMEEAKDQLENREEEEEEGEEAEGVENEDINTTFLQVNNALIERNTSQEIFDNDNPPVEPHLETPTASTSKTCPTCNQYLDHKKQVFCFCFS